MFACVVVQCGDFVGDNHSPAPIYERQWDIVVLDRHLVLLVLAALVIWVGSMCVCGARQAHGHMCWLYVCVCDACV